MGVEKLLDASTGHITYEDSVKLLEYPEGFPTRVISHEFGWWINVLLEKEFEEEVILAIRELGYSDPLIKLMRVAYEQRCWWIYLDCDGAFVDGLEIIDW